MPSQPVANLLRLVGPVVVHDQMHGQSRRYLRLDASQEAQEFVRPMAPVQLADDLAGGDVESREERCGAMSAVVVGAAFGDARSQGQDGLGAIEGLNLGLLVHAQDQGVDRRIEVEPDYVTHLLDELGVVGKLEALNPVRLQSEGMPDAGNAV